MPQQFAAHKRIQNTHIWINVDFVGHLEQMDEYPISGNHGGKFLGIATYNKYSIRTTPDPASNMILQKLSKILPHFWLDLPNVGQPIFRAFHASTSKFCRTVNQYLINFVVMVYLYLIIVVIY